MVLERNERKEKLKPQGEAVIFLVYDRKKGCVWLEERLKPGSGYFGYRIIPGGKIEKSETPRHALDREVKEEMGIKVLKFTYLDYFVDMSFSGNLIRHHAYLVTDFEGEVFNREEPEGKSRLFPVPLSEAKDFLEIASSRYIIELAKKKLGF